jgi:hypothetical protein
MFACRLPSPRSKLGLYLVTRRNHGKRSTFLWSRPQAVLFFRTRNLQLGQNKGLNPLFFAFDWIYTSARRDRDLWGELECSRSRPLSPWARFRCKGKTLTWAASALRKREKRHVQRVSSLSHGRQVLHDKQPTLRGCHKRFWSGFLTPLPQCSGNSSLSVPSIMTISSRRDSPSGRQQKETANSRVVGYSEVTAQKAAGTSTSSPPCLS